MANPSGAQVAAGAASFSQPDAHSLVVSNTPGAIINWQAFSVGSGELTRFVQASPASAVLNRVVGADPSVILGALRSNGQVFLVNRNGLVVGPSAVIDTAGFVGSTLNITDRDFLEGRLDFSGGPAGATISNEGLITASGRGNIFLVGSSIENRGTLRSEGGTVLLAAGEKVSLGSLDSPDVKVQIQAPSNAALNLGRIESAAGAVQVFAGTLRHSGEIDVGSVRLDAAGNVVLSALGETMLAAGSRVSADGAQAGKVTINSDTGTTLVAGSIQARGIAAPPGSDTNPPAGDGKGGTVRVLGKRVALADGADIDVSGTNGGGTVLTGGGWQGADTTLRNATATHVASTAKVKADAIAHGDGGTVVVWADEVTTFHGAVTARGGASGGDGGRVEVSGKRALAIAGTVDLGAPRGALGTLLLDPEDVVVSDTVGTDNAQLNAGVPGASDPAGVIFFVDGGAVTFTITDEALETQTANITLRATRDATLAAGLSGGLTLVNPGQTFTIQAGRHITVGSPITTSNGSVMLSAGDPASGAAVATAAIAVNANITTAGANLTISNPQASGTSTIATGVTLNLGGGRLDASGATTGLATAVNSTTTLQNATLSGVLDVNNNAILRLRGTVVLDGGTLRTLGAASFAQIVGADSNTQVNLNAGPGGGMVRFEGSSANNRLFADASFGGARFAIGGNVTVSGTQGGTVGLGTGGSNAGTVLADQPGRTITVQGGNWTNTGNLHANGGILTLNSSFNTTWGSSAPGTLTLDSGTLNLDGDFSTASFETLVRPNDADRGTLNLLGTLDNTGDTLSFDAAQGTLNYSGASGRILGGNVAVTGGALNVATGQTGIFDNATLSGVLDVNNNAILRLRGTVVLDGGTLRTLGAASFAQIVGADSNTQVNLNAGPGGGMVRFEGSSANNRLFADASFGGARFAIGGNVTVSGTQGGTVGLGTGGSNAGTVLADQPGRTITVQGGNWTNTGNLHANGGILTLNSSFNTTWGSSAPGTLTLDSGTLNLDGDFSTASFETLVRPNDADRGTLNLLGTLDNTGDTLSFDAAQGTLNYSGASGRILGGNVAVTGGALNVATGQTGIFDNATLSGMLDVNNNAILRLRGTVVLDGGTLRTLGAASFAQIVGADSNTQVNLNAGPGGGMVRFEGSSANNRLFADASFGGARFAIGGNVTVSGTQGGTVGLGTGGSNAGTVLADQPGRTITVQGGNWTNTGNLHANGGILTLNSSFNTTWGSSAPGTLTLDSGTLNLDGDFSTASFETLVRPNDADRGTLNLLGTLDNTGDTLSFDAAQGTLNYSGASGRILGGNVAVTGGALNVATGQTGIFDNATLSGVLDVNNNAILRLRGTVVLDGGTLRTLGAASFAQIVGADSNTQVNLNAGPGGGMVRFEGSSANNRLFADASFGGARFAIGGNVTVSGTQGGTVGLGTGGSNAGTVLADQPGRTITVQGGNWTNTGNLHANGGILTLDSSFNTTWGSSSPGTLTLDSGTLNLDGDFSTASFETLVRPNDADRGTLNITGTLDNTGDTVVFSDATGVVNLASGGTVNGGTVQQSGSGAFNLGSSGSLTGGVVLDMDIVVPDFSSLNIRTGGDLTLGDGRSLTLGSSSSLTFAFGGAASQQLKTTPGGSASVLFNSTGTSFIGQSSAATLTIGPGVTLGGSGHANINLTDLTNQGTISQSVAGKTLTLNATTFANAGNVNVTGGTLNLTASGFSNTGGNMSASGGGVLRLATNASTPWSNGGVIRAAAGGTVELDGNGNGVTSGITTAFFDTLDGTVGTLRLAGRLDNTGAVLEPSASTGSLLLASGAVVRGGTLRGGSGGATLSMAGSASVEFSAVDLVDMDLAVPDFSSLNMRTGGDLTLGNGRTLTLGSSSSLTFAFGGVTSQQLKTTPGGSASVLFNSTGTGFLGQSSASTLTIAPGVTLGGSGNANINLTGLTNQGNISQSATGKTFTLNATTFANSGNVAVTGGTLNLTTGGMSNPGGNMSASGGGVLRLATNASTPWSNGGVIRAAAGGIVELDGNGNGVTSGITTAFFDTLDGTAGTLRLAGRLDNTGVVLEPSASTGSLLLASGAIVRGGTLRAGGGGATLSLAGSASVELSAVDLVDMDLVVPDFSSLNMRTGGDLTLGNGRSLTLGSSSSLTFAFGGVTSQQLKTTPGGSASVLFDSTGTGFLGQSSAATLTIGPGVTLGGSGHANVNLTGLTNQGAISQSAVGKTLTLNATTFANAGNVNVTGGTLNLTASGFSNTGGNMSSSGGVLRLATNASTPWSNGGVIRAAAGGIVELDGNGNGVTSGITSAFFDTLDGTAGTLRLAGRLDNTGAVLEPSASTGSLLLASGAIVRGGTLRGGSGGATLSLAGSASVELSAVDLVDMDLVVPDFSSLNMRTGGDLTLGDTRTLTLGSSSSLTFAFGGVTSQQLKTTPGGNASVLFDSSGTGFLSQSSTSTLTIGPGVTLGGSGHANINLTDLTNQGTIEPSGAGKTWTLNPTSFTNNGILGVQNGATISRTGGNLTNPVGGIIRGNGTFNVGANALHNSGTIQPGNSPGLTTITGNLVLTGSSVIDFEVTGLQRGISYDAIDVSGNATLAGTANMLHLAPYVPSNGDTFRVVSAANTLSGSFGTVNVPVAFNAQYDSRNALIQMGGASQPVLFWDIDAGGNWDTAANWNLGRVPTAADVVIIDRGAANPLITVNNAVSAAAKAAGQLQSAENLSVTAGTLTISGAASFDSQLTISGGTLDLAGTSSVNALTLFAGTLQGAGTVTVGGPLVWSAGTMSGVGATVASQGASMTGGVRSLDNRTLTLNANTTLASGATLNVTGGSLDGTGTFSNQGVLVLANATLGATLANTAALTIAAGSTTTLNGPFSNASTGTLTLAGSGAVLNVANGFTNQGLVNLQNTAAGGNISTLNVAAGTLTNAVGATLRSSGAVATANVLDAALTNLGTLDVQRPLLINNTARTFDATSSTITLASGQTLTVNGGTTRLGTGTSILGAGARTLATTGSNTLDLTNDLVLPAGGFVLSLGGTPTLASSNGGGALLTNPAGSTFNLTGGTIDSNVSVLNQGDATLSTVTGNGAFSNPGSLTIAAGTTTTMNGALSNTSTGTLTLAGAGATLGTNSANLTNAGTLRGTGVLDLGTATLTNDGVLAPGATGPTPTGTLAITGNLTLNPGGTVQAQLAGTTQGVDYDYIPVTGNVSLGGTLDVTLVAPFTPGGADQFQPISCAGGASCRSGSFATVNNPVGSPFTPSYGSSAFSLSLGALLKLWIVDASGDWGLGANWSGGSVPTASDEVLLDRVAGLFTITVSAGAQSAKSLTGRENLTIAGGSLTLGAGSSVFESGTTLTLSGGNLDLLAGGTLSLAGNANWSAASTIAGPGNLSVASGGLLTVSGSNAHQLSNITLANAGTVRYATVGNDLLVDDGSLFDNLSGGIFDIQGDILVRTSSGSGAFDNAGTVRKTAGTGIGGFDATLPFNNDGGLIDAASGAFELNGGGSHGGAFRTAGNGVNLTGGIHGFAAGSSIDGLVFLNGGATLNAVGNPTVNASLVWNGPSTITGGALDVAPGGVLSIVGTGNRRLAAATVQNRGTVDYLTAGNDLLIDDGAEFNNLAGALFDIQADVLARTASGTGVFNNAGMVLKSVGGGSGGFDATLPFNNDGVTTSASGTLTLGGGTHTGSFVANAGQFVAFAAGVNLLADGSTLSGAGTLQFTGGTLDVTGNAAGATIAAGNTFSLSGQALGGTGRLTNLGTLNLADSTFAPSLDNRGVFSVSGSSRFDGASLTLTSGTMNLAAGATLTNNGNLRFSGGALTIASGASLDNAGSFDLAGDLPVSGLGTLQNSGSFTKSAGGGVALMSARFDNDGLLRVDFGELALAGLGNSHAGNFTIASAAVLDFGAGTNSFGGASQQVNGAGLARLSGGTLNIGSTLDVSCGLDIAGGTLIGGGTLATSGLTALLGPANTTLGAATTWNNTGTVNWSGGSLDLSTAASLFDNRGGGMFNAVVTAASFDILGAGSFTNRAGALFDSRPVAVDVNVSANFSNTGTIDVRNVLQLERDFVNQGRVRLMPGASLRAGAGVGDFRNAAGGVVEGFGDVVAPAAGSFVNEGELRPGSSPGALSVEGNLLMMPSSVLRSELGGTVRGVGYDALDVSGTATLDGALVVSLVNGFPGSVGQSFDLVGYGAGSGGFSSITGPAGYGFAGLLDPTLYVLRLTAVQSLAAPLPRLPVVLGGITSNLLTIAPLASESGFLAGDSLLTADAGIASQPRRAIACR